MIDLAFVLPTAAALLVGLVLALVQHRLSPAVVTVGLTVLAAGVATAVAGVVVLVAVLFVVQVPWLAEHLDGCLPVAEGHEVPAWQGLLSVAGAMVMGVSGAGTARHLRPPQLAGAAPLMVLPTDRPTAFALPGAGGGIVVSAGMLRHLNAQERRVLVAHERSHLERRHHRYLAVGAVAAAAVPVLRPVLERIHFATERWADEDACREVGDRVLVARAIARAALAQAGSGQQPSSSMAFGGVGVRARVEALLARPVAASHRRWCLAGAVGAVAVGSVASAVQLHHLATMLDTHLC